MAGCDSFVFTDLPRGAGSPVWAPDRKNIAFTSDTNAEDLAKQEKKKSEEQTKKSGGASGTPAPRSSASAKASAGKPPNKPTPTPANKTDSDHESDVRVITRAVYRQDNEGYVDPKH